MESADDRRVSTAGYTTASDIPTGYVPCLERQEFAVEQKPVPATSQEDDAVFILSSDDVGITVKNEDVKTHVEKPNDFMELTIVACLFNFLFAMVAMSLSFKSKDSWRLGYRRGAQLYGLASMAMSLFSIVTTAIIVFVLVWWFVLGGSLHTF